MGNSTNTNIEKNKLLMGFLKASNEPILITNTSVEIVYANPAWEKLTGYTQTEVIGKKPKILSTSKTNKQTSIELWKNLKKNKPYVTEDLVNKKKNGDNYAARASYFSVLHENKPLYYIQLHHDISKQKHVENMRKEFLSTAAHELKTPITVLKLITDIHSRKANKDGQDVVKPEELSRISYELDRLNALVDDILDSTRLERGNLRINMVEFNLTHLIQHTCKKLQRQTKTHKIILNKIPKINIYADEKRIEQVLVNFINNAIKYSPDNKDIEVSVKNENSSVTIYIKDQGLGIPKDMQRHIFDKYFQVENKPKNGFGLGLFISKAIIKAHKGNIGVRSQPGKGSTFWFSLKKI